MIPNLLKMMCPLLSKQSNAARHVGAWSHTELIKTVREAKKKLLSGKKEEGTGGKNLLFEVVVQHLAC